MFHSSQPTWCTSGKWKRSFSTSIFQGEPQRTAGTSTWRIYWCRSRRVDAVGREHIRPSAPTRTPSKGSTETVAVIARPKNKLTITSSALILRVEWHSLEFDQRSLTFLWEISREIVSDNQTVADIHKEFWMFFTFIFLYDFALVTFIPFSLSPFLAFLSRSCLASFKPIFLCSFFSSSSSISAAFWAAFQSQLCKMDMVQNTITSFHLFLVFGISFLCSIFGVWIVWGSAFLIFVVFDFLRIRKKRETLRKAIALPPVKFPSLDSANADPQIKW